MRPTLHLLVLLAVFRPALAQDSTLGYGDSTTFDPGGYYVPANPVVIEGHELRHFEVQALEYYYDDALHYDRPRLLVPRANIVIAARPAQPNQYTCTVLAANADSLRLTCAGTPIGDVLLETAYVDHRGRYWSIIDYELEPRVVARGRLIIRRTGVPPQSLQLELIYTAGH